MASEKIPWLVFLMTQPGKSPTPRMRLWRLLKGWGAGVLGGGVSLLRAGDPWRRAREDGVGGVKPLGGAAFVLAAGPLAATDAHFRAFFDRSEEYAELL